MNRHALAAALVAGLVLLAGCSSGFTGSPDGTTGESALDGETTAEEIEGETGTLNMYISDEENAIEDFEHLNVTITRVGVKPAGDDSGDDDAEDDEEADDDTEDTTTEIATEDGDDNETTEDANTTESVETETETPDAEDGSDDEDDSDEADDSDDEDDSEAADDTDEADDADEADDEDDDSDDDEGDGEWVEYEVDNRTVDLTELKGANATKLSSLEVPNGTYEKVFVYVSEVNGTLKDGSDQRVKLPSGKLQLNSEFTVGDGEEVDFVFDITVVKAGNSGKYILKPVISESGTDVEIDDVDERDEDEREDDEDDEREDEEERGDDERDEDRDTNLNASFDGNVTAGENVTLSVTSDGEAVEGATVFVDGERAGTTDANGTYVIQVPDDAEELEVEITYQGAEAELEVEFDDEDDDETNDESDDTEESDETATANESQQRLTVG